MGWVTLVDVLRGRAQAQGAKTAFTSLADDGAPGPTVTFAALDRNARAVAAQLQAAGAVGARVLLLYPPGTDFIAAFLGCLYAGCVAVPSYPPQPSRMDRSSGARLAAIIRDAAPRFALTTTALEPRVQALCAETGGALQCLVPTIESDEAASGWAEPDIHRDTVAFLQYTSGTTGPPRGVLMTHANVMHDMRLIEAAFAVTEEDSGVCWLPPYHDMGLIGGLIQPVYQGTSVVLMSPVSFLHRPLRWLEAMSRFGATISGGPDFAYDLCARRVTDEQKAGLDLSRWRVALNGAEPVRPDTLAAFGAAFAPCGFSARAWSPCYGLAEATLFVCGGPRGDAPQTRRFDRAKLESGLAVAVEGDDGGRDLVPSGTPPEGQRIVIVRLEGRTPCPPGHVGELWVQGDNVGAGYWNDDALSDDTFKAHLVTGDGPFLRTGDIGFLYEGELFVTGRLADAMRIEGRALAPQDIEAAVEAAHPALRRSAVAAFTVDTEDGSPALVVVGEVERQSLNNLDPADVTAAVRRHVRREHGLEPRAVVLLKTATIPKTSSGKTQRHACRASYLAGTLEAVASG